MCVIHRLPRRLLRAIPGGIVLLIALPGCGRSAPTDQTPAASRAPIQAGKLVPQAGGDASQSNQMRDYARQKAQEALSQRYGSH